MMAALARTEIFAPRQDCQIMTKLFLAAEQGYLLGRASLEPQQGETHGG